MVEITEKKAVYTLYEVGEKFGIDRIVIDTIIKDKRFDIIPFSVIELNGEYYCAKNQVDNFVGKGIRPNYKIDKKTGNRVWTKEQYTMWHCRVPKALADKFKKICNNMNKRIPVKIKLHQYRIVAIQEFVDRRPEYLEDID